MLKFLPGILVLQLATAALVVAIVKTTHEGYWLTFGLLTLFTSFLTAFWFGSIASHVKKDALLQAQDHFAKEREKIRLKAEKEKTKVIEQSHQKIAKETSRAHAKANFKVGGAFAAALCAGIAMLFVEFVTFGLLTLSTACGGLAGYVLRSRQEKLPRRRQTADTLLPVKVIEGETLESTRHGAKKSG